MAAIARTFSVNFVAGATAALCSGGFVLAVAKSVQQLYIAQRAKLVEQGVDHVTFYGLVPGEFHGEEAVNQLAAHYTQRIVITAWYVCLLGTAGVMAVAGAFFDDLIEPFFNRLEERGVNAAPAILAGMAVGIISAGACVSARTPIVTALATIALTGGLVSGLVSIFAEEPLPRIGRILEG